MTGVRVHDKLGDTEFDIEAGFVLNASGAWAAQILHMAGIEDVGVVPGKGIMIAMNHRLVDAVVNRLAMPGDGDILVPIRTVSVIGTTDIHAADPDEIPVTQEEVDQMLDDGERLVPGFRQARALRVWAGVRPLFQDARRPRRGDRHARRQPHARGRRPRRARRHQRAADDVRRQADDAAADGAGPGRRDGASSAATIGPCARGDVRPPGNEDGESYTIGSRLRRRERDAAGRAADLRVRADRARASSRRRCERRHTTDLDDIRRALRLGMGPCQGGFCMYRATGILHEVEQLDGEQAGGVAAGLPAGALEGRVADPLRRPAAPGAAGRLDLPGPARRGAPAGMSAHHDVIVVGTGLAGLTAAVRLAESGARVLVLAKGIGATHRRAGHDRRARLRARSGSTRRSRRCRRYLAERPGHPYAARRRRGHRRPRSTGSRSASRLHAARSRPTCCCRPPSACRGRRPSCRRRWRTATCARGRGRGRGLPRRSRTSTRRCAPTGLRRAERRGALDRCSTSLPRAAPTSTSSGTRERSTTPAFRDRVLAQLAPQLREGERVAFPAVLGITSPHEVFAALEDAARPAGVRDPDAAAVGAGDAAASAS